MSFTYEHPLVIKSGPEELRIVKVKLGTTTVELSDGKILRLTISVESVKVNAADPNSLDINHSITTEIMVKPEFPVADGPGTIQ